MRVVVHADEACLGNGREEPTPGGAGGLVEVYRTGLPTGRRDYFVSEPDTTNNRMALRSAIEVLELLDAKQQRLDIEFWSDSNYLVTGMKEWMPAWRARGWKRKEGRRLAEVANVEMWQRLEALAARHDCRWHWVRGHAGHPRNEYANELATSAARNLSHSGGLVESAFPSWLERERAKGRYRDFDPDRE
jgi:ribonuclease HI